MEREWKYISDDDEVVEQEEKVFVCVEKKQQLEGLREREKRDGEVWKFESGVGRWTCQ
ncbi:hypothetical protein MTR_7g056123 [Medicago truncatula]|uniref:Uncharacterized protein n=1 Tax=Medicago truncatula TaxID=3880 RepID=A0A072TYV6_MEDTR|nr:hypothetical protein MTR_7g056123 [Medicago truncatula]